MIKKHHVHSFGLISILGISTVVIAAVVVMLVTRPKMGEAPQPVGNNQPAQPSQPAEPEANIAFDNLISGQTISGSFTVTGMVKGWFFEGSFPVYLKDANGNQLAIALAGSTESWMTADPIPFSVTLPDVAYQGPGTIVFAKDNPSGLPENDESYSIQVIFQ